MTDVNLTMAIGALAVAITLGAGLVAVAAVAAHLARRVARNRRATP